MKTIKTFKVPIQDNYDWFTNVSIIRVAISKDNYSHFAIPEGVITTFLTNTVEEGIRQYGDSIYINDLSKFIDDVDIVETKVTEIDNYMYVQGVCVSHTAPSKLSRTAIAQFFNHCRIGDYPVNENAIGGFISLIGSSCEHMIYRTGDLALTNRVVEFSTIQNDLCLEIRNVHNNDKKYCTNNSVKMELVCYNNLEDALKYKSTKTISQGAYSKTFPILIYKKLMWNSRERLYKYKTIYDNKINLTTINGKTVFYDGVKALDTVRPIIEKLPDPVRVVDVLQFSLNKDLYYWYEDNLGVRMNKLVFICSQDKNIRIDNQYLEQNYGYMANITLLHKNHNRSLPIDCNSLGTSYLGTFIIPLDDNFNLKENVCESILGIVNNSRGSNERRDYCYQYLKTLQHLTDEEIGDDVLARWFTYCNQSAKTESQQIVKTYQFMKDKLVQEYRDINVYLNQYDFSKCTPVPKVRMDKKLKENYYNSLHIQPINIIINSINGKNINPVQSIRPTIHFMFQYKNKYWDGDLPLMGEYDRAKNIIELNYKKLKGAIIYDKVKNRR